MLYSQLKNQTRIDRTNLIYTILKKNGKSQNRIFRTFKINLNSGCCIFIEELITKLSLKEVTISFLSRFASLSISMD